jgi:hypothetical protein
MRTVIILFAVIALATVDTIWTGSHASAQQQDNNPQRIKRSGVMGGYCPAGTCAVNGGRRAMVVSDCKASNCRH